ncbi:hypothetical protein OBV_14900 [Oscillibacter valericigenes Sjm18-20]|nr:hypothetical protein OBV_14900 [Oscillibacter valericigenes Sjm18-20]
MDHAILCSPILLSLRKTAAERWDPEQAGSIYRTALLRAEALFRENATAGKALRPHLHRQILPMIAVYETLRTVLDQPEALAMTYGIALGLIPAKAEKLRRLLKFPNLYRLVPGVFGSMTDRFFGAGAGFSARKYPVKKGEWHLDMLRCPYFETCKRYGCPELTKCFCDSDDICYGHMHQKLVWERTKTLGKGGDCCDFHLYVKEG